MKAERKKEESGKFYPLAVDLRARGIDETQAADLRVRLKAFAEDWERPEVQIYDNPSRRHQE